MGLWSWNCIHRIVVSVLARCRPEELPVGEESHEREARRDEMVKSTIKIVMI